MPRTSSTAHGSWQPRPATRESWRRLPKKIIPDRAAEHDAVYIGGHGRTGAARILLGSVAESVVRRSPVPVTVVK